MSFFSRARRRLLRRPPKSPSAGTTSSEDPTASPSSPSPPPSSTILSSSSETTAPDSPDQSQDPDREPEEALVDPEEDDNEDEPEEDDDGDDSSDTDSSSSDEEDATPTTPSNPPATSDTDVDIAASGTPPANPLFPPSTTSLLSGKSRAWLSPDPAALKPQLFLDLSKMTPFASPSGRPFGRPAEADSQPGIFTFGAEVGPQTGFKSTGLGLFYGEKYTNKIVTLKIGTDEVPFQIHKSILTQSCPVFDKMLNGPFVDSTQSEVRLDEDDPDAFGIIIEWLYTGTMAMFNPVWVNKTIQMCHPGGRSGDESVIHVPLPSYFGTPTASHELAMNGLNGPYQAMYQHICTQNLYAGLSPEEIRLVEHFPANKDVVMGYVSFLQGRGGKDKEERSTSKDQAQFMLTPDQAPVDSDAKIQRLLNYLETVEQVPIPVPFPAYIEAEYLQLVLIKVLITADKYCWEDLFNDAMDAFRVGEQHLGRRHPVVRHIELAYTYCPRKSPLVTLMADMAFYAGKAYQSQGELVEVGSQYPEFLEDLTARYDKQISIPGYDPIKDALKLFRGPLSKAGGTYHYHATKDSLSGPCPPRCIKRHRERTLRHF